MSEPYRPSNATEGDIFMARWCFQCVKCEPDDKDPCPILGDTLALNLSDKGYPVAWITDEESGPRCTAFQSEDGLEPLDPKAVICPLL